MTPVTPSTRFPPDSPAEQDHRLLGNLQTVQWDARRARWSRNQEFQVPSPPPEPTLPTPAARQDLRKELAAVTDCPIMMWQFAVPTQKGTSRTVHFAECGGRRPDGRDTVGLLRVLRVLIMEIDVWGLNMPRVGPNHPEVVGTQPVDSNYIGGFAGKRDLEHQQTYLPGGYMLVAGLADGRAVRNGKKSTMISLWVPCTGAGGAQVGGMGVTLGIGIPEQLTHSPDSA